MGIKSILPLDSYESLLKAAIKFDGIEGDVQLLQSGDLVFWHNKFFKDSLISQLQSEENSYFYFYKKYRISKVVDVLEKIPEGKVVSFDIKLYGCDTVCKLRMVEEIKKIVTLYSDRFVFFIETNDEFLIEELSGLKVFYYSVSAKDALSACESKNIFGISINNSRIDSLSIIKIKNKGCKIMLWGIKNRKQLKNALNKNPDYIQTDFIKIKLDN